MTVHVSLKSIIDFLKPKLPFAFYLLSVALYLSSSSFAWGYGTHLVHGSMVIVNPSVLIPQVANILTVNSIDYMYGLVCADFFIGKGEQGHDGHYHNWSFGNKILKNASTDAERAFAYGYLSHLAADVMAHNYFIPIFLHYKKISKKLTHIYWEVVADSLLPDKLWRHLQSIVHHNHDANDHLVNESLASNRTTFKIKKFIFKRAMDIQNMKTWQWRVKRSHFKHPRSLDNTIKYFQKSALALVVDMLNKGESSVVMNYDPIGSHNLSHFDSEKILIPEDLFDVIKEYKSVTERMVI